MHVTIFKSGRLCITRTYEVGLLRLGSYWIPIDPYESYWVPLESYCIPLDPTGSLWTLYRIPLDPTGSIWILLHPFGSSTGSLWILLHPFGSYSIPLGSLRNHTGSLWNPTTHMTPLDLMPHPSPCAGCASFGEQHRVTHRGAPFCRTQDCLGTAAHGTAHRCPSHAIPGWHPHTDTRVAPWWHHDPTAASSSD